MEEEQCNYPCPREVGEQRAQSRARGAEEDKAALCSPWTIPGFLKGEQ